MTLSYLEAQEHARELHTAVTAAFRAADVEIPPPTLNRAGSNWFAEVRVRLPLGEVRRDG